MLGPQNGYKTVYFRLGYENGRHLTWRGFMGNGCGRTQPIGLTAFRNTSRPLMKQQGTGGRDQRQNRLEPKRQPTGPSANCREALYPGDQYVDGRRHLTSTARSNPKRSLTNWAAGGTTQSARPSRNGPQRRGPIASTTGPIRGANY